MRPGESRSVDRCALLEHGGNPRTPAALARLLGDLGWTVEVAPPTSRGTQLDVVVSEV